MELSDTAKLVRLSDTNLALEHAAEDVRGCAVIDSDGKEIGHVDDLMVDETHKKVRFIVVGAGGFLGLGETKFWLPVDAVRSVKDSTVHIDMNAEHVKGTPTYDPEVVEAHPYANDIYAYYGMVPYWGAGYTYPAFPFPLGGPAGPGF